MTDEAAPETIAAPIPVTVERASELFNVTDKTVRSWIRGGLPVLKAGGKGRGNGALIDLAVLIPWYLEENALDVAKTRLASAQADKHEMENAQRRGELADLKDVESAWTDMALAFRSKLLSMPTKLAPQLTNVSDTSVIATRIRGEVFAALDDLAESQDDVGAEQDAKGGGAETEAASGAHRKRVGRRKSKAEQRIVG